LSPFVFEQPEIRNPAALGQSSDARFRLKACRRDACAALGLSIIAFSTNTSDTLDYSQHDAEWGLLTIA